MKKYLPILAVIAATILSAVLHFWKIDTIGDSNAYYTAAVEAMTQSWHNFFFAAAEPGGSVTVDKPPLGLMIETVFALVLGVSGFSTSLPNILAGILSVPLMYHLVRKHFGELAGVVAALVMALTPVVFAADRNNTMDGMLTFTLILAAWAFIKAVETGRARWLFLGAFIVGLGFNIKMLQAFLPLPAFLALYFFGAKAGWFKKIGLLSASMILLLAVSLSWALIVDSVPAEERPYIGSSQDNSVMGLILGHNGTARLFGGRGGNQATPPAGPQAGPAFDGPDGFNPYVSPDAGAANPPGLANPPQGAAPARGQGGGGIAFSNETGTPGVFRFFEPPLGAEMSWLLPFALFSIVVVAVQWRPRFPITQLPILGLILWGGWLLTCVAFFSAVSGIFHAYYAIMLAPGLAGMVGGGFGALWQMQQNRKWAGWLLAAAAMLTIVFQIYLAWQFGVTAFWQPLAFALAALGTILLMAGLFQSSSFWSRAAYALLLAAMLTVPFAWSALTVARGADANLPAAYGVNGRAGGPRPGNAAANDDRPAVLPAANTDDVAGDALLAFLEANTQDVEYLVAVPSSQVGARYVIATGRPVLYMGGFSGNDPVVDAADLAEMVANGELRYVLYGGGQRNDRQDISNWLASSCSVIEEFSQRQVAAVGPGFPRPPGPNGQFPVGPNAPLPGGPGNGGNILYDCG